MWETDVGGESKTQDLKEGKWSLSWLHRLRSNSSAEDDCEGEECLLSRRQFDSLALCALPLALNVVAADKIFVSGLCASFSLIPRWSCLFTLLLHVGDLRGNDTDHHHDISPPLVFKSRLWSHTWQGSTPKTTIFPVYSRVDARWDTKQEPSDALTTPSNLYNHPE